VSASADRDRAQVFEYVGFDLSPAGLLTCHYRLDAEVFAEEIDCGVSGGRFAGADVEAAARLVFLLAGVSYYKTAAPPLIVGPAGGLTSRERDFLLEVYLSGLAEFSLTSGTDLRGLRIEAPTRQPAPVPAAVGPGRPLIPFGGGIDSIVVVEQHREHFSDCALFVVNSSDVDFEPIESTAAITGLPVLRARRHLDRKVLESRARGYLNGHVPVTGIISAVGLLVALAHGRDRLVMSNELSASEPTRMSANGVLVNHQWSKGYDFESSLRSVLEESVTGLDYYSALRPYSELWVGARFAELRQYHSAFRSCNKAFFIDATSRLPSWCGECDKCCFIDLILAPFLDVAELRAIFRRSPRGLEPLENPELEGRFRSLLGAPGRSKPLECVGDEGECRRAVRMAAARPDRTGSAMLGRLLDHVTGSGLDVPETATLLSRQGPHFLPETLTDDLVG